MAQWAFPASFFTVADEQGMIFVEQSSVRRQVGGEKRLIAAVAFVRGFQPEAVDDAPGVGVDDEGGFVAGVEDNRVGGLFPYTVDIQELVSHRLFIVIK